MTTQVPDDLLWKGRKYWILEARGSGLSLLSEFGIEPAPLSSACWRGYIASYKTRQGRLLLDRLTVRDRHGTYPPINGVLPETGSGLGGVYKKLELPVSFSGQVQVGRTPSAQEISVWPLPENYQAVFGLHFQEGMLVTAHDRTADLAGEPWETMEAPAEPDIPTFLRKTDNSESSD